MLENVSDALEKYVYFVFLNGCNILKVSIKSISSIVSFRISVTFAFYF